MHFLILNKKEVGILCAAFTNLEYGLEMREDYERFEFNASIISPYS